MDILRLLRTAATLSAAAALNTACAAELFVSAAGNDSNQGNRNAPLKSISRAIGLAKPGDTVKILPGIYRGSVTINNSGTAQKPIKICGTRSENGKILTVIESDGEKLTNWVAAPEIGENVWKTPLKRRPDIVMLDGRFIAQINKFNMVLARRTPLPAQLTAEHIWGNFSPGKSKRLSGLDLLAVSKDITVTHPYFKKRIEPLWDVLGYVLCGWHKGNLYLRFANGSSPEKHVISAANGDGIILKNASHIILSDLHIRGSRTSISITDKSRGITVENSLLMHGCCRIKIEKDTENITVRNNIITGGFIQNKHFKCRRSTDMAGGLTYLVFKYVIGAARSDDAGIIFYGKNCDINNNIIMNGLLGIDAGGPGAKVHRNCIKGMASCGIVTGTLSSGEFYENLVADCGIALRIHDWRHERFYRQEYHYRNLFMQPDDGGSNLHIYSASHKIGHDKVNYDKKGIYKENPPAPFDPGRIFIYHNTFTGASAHIWPVKNYYLRFRKQPMPFYFVNNIIKASHQWDMRHQKMLAGNLMYDSAKTVKRPAKGDKNVGRYNRITSVSQLPEIWVDRDRKGVPDIRLKENSPALECAVDISKPSKSNGADVPALPGFKAGYYAGKLPAAGAVQPGNDELMQHFSDIHKKMLAAEAAIGRND